MRIIFSLSLSDVVSFFFTDSKIMIEIANFGKAEAARNQIYFMVVPNDDTYTDVNSDSLFIGLTMETVRNYLQKFEKKFENRITQLYDENFLMYFRFSKKDSYTYIRCSCRAEMKKRSML